MFVDHLSSQDQFEWHTYEAQVALARFWASHWILMCILGDPPLTQMPWEPICAP